MATVTRTHRVEFSDGETTTTLTLGSDSQNEQPYATARDRLCTAHNISLAEFERQWEQTAHTVAVSFADPPWDSDTALQTALESIDGVARTRYVGSLDGNYSPPKYVVHLSGSDADAVSAAITDYYDGLTVTETPSGRLNVIVSAVTYSNQ